MGWTLYTMVWAVCTLPSPPGPAACGRLWEAGDCGWAWYCPQEGDVLLFDGKSRMWNFLDLLALTGPPDHSGLIVKRPDGQLALLEAGPDSRPQVFLIDDIYHRLCAFQGVVWVRRIQCPLTAEQSACLTAFALEQEGKRYALGRFLLQITPIRGRGWLRSKWLGHTHYHRRGWICSELVAAGLAAAGLVDPRAMPANVVYPRDFMSNRRYDLGRWALPAQWGRFPKEIEGVK